MNTASSLLPPSSFLHRVETVATNTAKDLWQRMDREPAKVLAAAAGAWLLLRVIPRRWTVGGLTSLVQPALFTLGVCKALEMWRHEKA